MPPINSDLIATLESALALAKRLEPAPSPLAPGPNPNQLTVAQVGDGYECYDPRQGFTEGSEYWGAGEWYESYGHNFAETTYRRPIPQPAPWTLPPPPAGQQWHRDDFTQDMLPEGYRPLLLGELPEDGDEVFFCKNWKKQDEYQLEVPAAGKNAALQRTTRPLPEPPAPPKGWDCPADVPMPICWVRFKGFTACAAMVTGYDPEGIETHEPRQSDKEFLEWSELAKYEHSRDGINFSPCHKTK